ncbi:hypothetical protein TCAL_14286 [Tigriopus californicus]|uniref:Uncharacterized protein n=1 Tax=Tigriopus californicus TaxID=6832 RepID=A0A553NC60_TIGCA|nr:kinesin light chain 1-like [Tigriopus californicus]TRY63033.1 hypothetical protein TCAL_14286 [Tigriopus californicus]
MESDNDSKRISPLRGDLTHEEIVNQTRVVCNGLGSLREDHYTILSRIRDEVENQRNTPSKPPPPSDRRTSPTRRSTKINDNEKVLQARISNVTKSLENLEIGIEESQVMIQLSDHFQRLEADHVMLRLEMSRVQDENDWLREELSDTQRKMQQYMLELTELQEEKKKWEFEEELKNIGQETNVRPITPSKIPVGSWRVEEEKDINRALNGDRKTSESRSASPAVSRIPVGGWRSKVSVYKSVMEKEQVRVDLKKKSDKNTGSGSKRQYFKLNASRSKIPSR